MNKFLLFVFSLCLVSITTAQTFVQSSTSYPTCFNTCDGNVVFTTTTTTGPFTAVLTNTGSCPNTTVQSSSGNSITISNLCACAANYSVNFYNSSMVLVGFELLQVPVTSTAQLILMTPTINPAACSTCCNGSLTANWSGGYLPSPNNPTVILDGNVIATNLNPYPSMCVGQHTLCIKDMANCTVCTTFSMSFVAVAGLNEQFTDSQFELYPNPASNKVEVHTTLSANIQLQIMDINGKVVLNTFISQNENKVSIDSLTEGVYTIQLIDENKNLIGRKKLIKITP